MRAISHDPVVKTYSRLAGRYDKLHRRWLRLAGGEGQSAFEAALVAQLRPGSRVLDAGCGTGALARHILQNLFPNVHITLLDASRAMLDRTSDIDARRVEACLTSLPFPDNEFDLVACAWALETTGNPERGISELLRVLRPGGALVTVFCATSQNPGMMARIVCQGIRMRKTGCFLDPQAIAAAAHGAGADDILRLRCSGPAVALVIRKPARPAETSAA